MADSTRSSQFSFAENICILEEYNAAKSTLMNKFNDYNGNSKKHKAWTTITERVNSVNPSVNRSVKDVQKRFKNMVQEAKKEIFKRKNPATGGGPSPKLKRTTEMIIEIYGDESPMFWGIPGGRESGVSGRTLPTAVEDTQSHTAVTSTPLGQSLDCEVTLTLVSQNDEAPVTSQDDQTTQSEDDDLDSTQMAPVGSGSDTERQKDTPSKITMNNILEKQYKILTLEETKLKLEIQKLELEKTKLKLELQKLGHEL
uniref:Myb/SANT-like DNA-binding domain-containing protein n=1 Tax=Cyprinus carpio TaxID=7962 RepID=A0A8C1Y2S6_CYPCA